MYYEKAEKAPLITADNIHYMDEDKCLVLAKGIRPFFARQLPYYKDWKYRGLLNKPFDFYMPNDTVEFKRGQIADLLKERSSDVQRYMRNFENHVHDVRDERVTVQSEGACKLGSLQETAEFPMDSL